jgi:hypothetical protein
MANEVALFGGSKLPAFARQREISAAAKAMAGGSAGSDRISIKGGVFRLVVGGKEVSQIEERYLDAVLVGAAPKVNRVWYGKKYDADSVSAPDCWSADGETPSEDSANKQADRCVDCAQNVKGSGEGESRACRYQQRIALVLAHGKAVEDEDGKPTLNHGDHGPLQLTVPAASLFGKAEGELRPLQEYARYLVAQKIDPSMLVTRIKFDTSAESPKLWFKPMRWLTDDEFTQVEAFAASDETRNAVEVTFGRAEGAGAPPALEGKKPTGKTKPAADEDEDPPAKPKPAAKKTAAKTKPAAQDDDDDAPPAKTKATKPPADEDDDDAPPAKTKATKPAAQDDDDDDTPPTTRKAAPAAPAAGAKKDAAALVDEWDD